MGINTAGEIEDSFLRRFNLGFELDEWHFPWWTLQAPFSTAQLQRSVPRDAWMATGARCRSVWLGHLVVMADEPYVYFAFDVIPFLGSAESSHEVIKGSSV